MAEINRVTLFGKLNPATYKVVEGATVFCKLRGNPTVELEHVVAQLLQSTDSDWHRVIQQAQLDSSVLAKDITLVMGVVLVFSTVLVLLNLAVDVLYAWVDPRISLTGRG